MKLKISEYAKLKSVTYRTVWNWIAKGQVQVEKTDTGRNFVILEDPHKELKVAIYCRVSSSENKDNLEAQKQRMLQYCNARGYRVAEAVTEIGSGLNDNRPKLEKLLVRKDITTIVVEHKDRLARFGLNYIQKLLEIDGRTIEVVNNVDGEEQDLMEDFVSIITSFTARLYGKRRTKRRTEKLIKKLQSDDN